MFSVMYVSPGGRTWDLTGDNTTGFALKAGGVEGLVGRSSVETQSADGFHGQQVLGHSVLPMDGALVGIMFPAEGLSLAETWRQWRADWSRKKYGRLIVRSKTGFWTANVRLSPDGMSAPETDLSDEQYVNPVRVAVESDEGVFFGVPQVQSGSVTVTNTGATTVWPRVRWEGNYRTLVYPSNNWTTLPNTVLPRVLYLDPAESHAVEDLDGKLDQTMWKAVRDEVLPEGVPEGESRQYYLSEGAFLEWEITTLDPWGW